VNAKGQEISANEGSSSFLRLLEGSRESAPTNNRKFTSDKRKQPQGKWACGRAGAR
jgi:hypothetical protein